MELYILRPWETYNGKEVDRYYLSLENAQIDGQELEFIGQILGFDIIKCSTVDYADITVQKLCDSLLLVSKKD